MLRRAERPRCSPTLLAQVKPSCPKLSQASCWPDLAQQSRAAQPAAQLMHLLLYQEIPTHPEDSCRQAVGCMCQSARQLCQHTEHGGEGHEPHKGMQPHGTLHKVPAGIVMRTRQFIRKPAAGVCTACKQAAAQTDPQNLQTATTTHCLTPSLSAVLNAKTGGGNVCFSSKQFVHKLDSHSTLLHGAGLTAKAPRVH